MVEKAKQHNFNGRVIIDWLKKNYVFVIILILYFCIYAKALTRLPVPNGDEAWVGETAVKLFDNHQRSFSSLYGAKLNFQMVPSYAIFLGLFLKIFGLGLVQARVFSILLGGIVILITYLLALRLYSQKIALLTAVFIVANPIFFLSARMIRPEIFSVAAIMLVLYLYILGQQEKKVRYFLIAGFIIPIGFFGHPHTIYILPAILVLFAFDYGWRFIKDRNFLYFIGGFLIGGLISFLWFWINEVVRKDVNEFYKCVTGSAKNFYLMRLQIFDHASLKLDFARWKTIWSSKIFTFGLKRFWLIGMLFAALRPGKNRLILISSLFLILGLLFLDTRKWLNYLVILIPTFSIIGALLSEKILELIQIEIDKEFKGKIKSTLTFLISAAVLISFGLISSSGLWYVKEAKKYKVSYGQIINQIDSKINKDDVIMGSPEYWFGLADHKYYSVHLVTWIGGAYSICPPDINQIYGRNFREFIKKKDVDIVIYNRNFETKVNVIKYFSASDINNFFENNCRLIKTIPDMYAGRNWQIRVYRVIKNKKITE